jgi:hypothetical protein
VYRTRLFACDKNCALAPKPRALHEIQSSRVRGTWRCGECAQDPRSLAGTHGQREELPCDVLKCDGSGCPTVSSLMSINHKEAAGPRDPQVPRFRRQHANSREARCSCAPCAIDYAAAGPSLVGSRKAAAGGLPEHSMQSRIARTMCSHRCGIKPLALATGHQRCVEGSTLLRVVRVSAIGLRRARVRL